MQKVLIVFGTRPEAIKLAPLIHRFNSSSKLKSIVCATGQHSELAEQMLGFFNLRVDYNFSLMKPNQRLSILTADLLTALQPVLEREKPDRIIVQGDTSSAMAGALAGFYNKIPVAHVEAGLRTDNILAPFPEEANRRIISVFADLHFAPTPAAKVALEREGHTHVLITGNTGIDALFWTRQRLRSGELHADAGLDIDPSRRMVLVTAHRRENFDQGLKNICDALRRIVRHLPDVELVIPVHPNPNVSIPLRKELTGLDRISLCNPLSYGSLVWLLDRASLILTDSGGIQEEATALGKPMLVLRDVTERPEALTNGNARLVGTDANLIVEEAIDILTDTVRYAAMSIPSSIFGDGRAADRIAETVEQG